jgi:hypothetical protein
VHLGRLALEVALVHAQQRQEEGEDERSQDDAQQAEDLQSAEERKEHEAGVSSPKNSACGTRTMNMRMAISTPCSSAAIAVPTIEAWETLRNSDNSSCVCLACKGETLHSHSTTRRPSRSRKWSASSITTVWNAARPELASTSGAEACSDSLTRAMPSVTCARVR